jgi:hypothetical protein
MKEQMGETKKANEQVTVRYNETSSLFASQFILNASSDDVTISFSSGPLADQAGTGTVLPVHTRIAMTRDGAKRLHEILGSVLAQNKTFSAN